jgi:hypothetical protein
MRLQACEGVAYRGLEQAVLRVVPEVEQLPRAARGARNGIHRRAAIAQSGKGGGCRIKDRIGFRGFVFHGQTIQK